MGCFEVKLAYFPAISGLFWSEFGHQIIQNSNNFVDFDQVGLTGGVAGAFPELVIPHNENYNNNYNNDNNNNNST